MRLCIAALLACLAAGEAAALQPDSYSMLNGYSGSYHYWDDTYNGIGCHTCDGALLTGGTGDLTNGVIATDNWFVVEPPGNGPYVGWPIDPTITFHWNAPVSIDSVTLWADDSNGNGGVSAPGSVTINGTNYVIPEPPGSAPFSFTASGLAFNGTDLPITIFRKNQWVFVSEVQFASNIPEPQTYAMLLTGFALLGFAARRRLAPISTN